MHQPLWTRTRVVTSLFALAAPVTALGQETQTRSTVQIEEIIVTAQKREQSANTVGMAITAATGDAMLQHGITSVAELTRLVPGLTIQQSSFNSTSFTLRGVGFFNSDLATPPAVTVYLGEAPLLVEAAVVEGLGGGEDDGLPVLSHPGSEPHARRRHVPLSAPAPIPRGGYHDARRVTPP